MGPGEGWGWGRTQIELTCLSLELLLPRSFLGTGSFSWEARVSRSGWHLSFEAGSPEQAFLGGCQGLQSPSKSWLTCVLLVLYSTILGNCSCAEGAWKLSACFTVPGSQGQRLGAGTVSPSVFSLIPLSRAGPSLGPSLVSVLCHFRGDSLESRAVVEGRRGQASVRVGSSLAAFLPAFHTPSSWGILSSFLFCY